MYVRLFVLSALLLSLVGFGLGCTSKSKEADSSAETSAQAKAWPEKMQLLSKTMSELLPLVASKKKFADPKNSEAIESRTETLRKLAHSVKAGPKPNADPSMQVVSHLMEEDITRALEALRSGNRDYARNVLRDTTSYCIQCHTQSNNGPEFPKLTLDVKVKDLAPLERAEFYAATRQFEPALETYREALGDPLLAKADAYDYETAARTALAISVRVHKDPKEASALVKTVRKNKALTPPLKTVSKQWEQSIQSWSKEKPTNDATPQARLIEAERLIAKAQKVQEFPLDHSQDITYFRASSILHELLQAPDRSDDFSARALYLAGLASEATRDMNFWTMHETMYEQCIRLRPETEQARQCYSRLNDSVKLGYSGSAGTNIPPEIKRRLDSYRTLAFGPSKSER
jgi:hypothetical protein